MFDVAWWKSQLERERKEKDSFFAGYWDSPIPPEDRLNFTGLAYYPPNPEYRFELELHEHPQKETIKMNYTKGDEGTFIRWGEFHFEIGGQKQTLQVYKSDPNEQGLFVPFRDATSGKETYPAGRYIDLDPERDLTPEGKWVLDFNRAYNPWCAYSEHYTCPLVPPENWLRVPIYAGEKDYPLRKH